jgi:hypothetical protein
MAGKGENNKRAKWKYKASEVKQIINKTSAQVWVTRCIKYLDEMDKKGRVPSLSSFYKDYNCWIYYLRDELGKGVCKDKAMVEKYELIKKIISEGMRENIIDRNASTATFAIALLQNQEEEGWDKRDKVTDVGAMSITFVNYALPTGDSAKELPTIDPNIIDAEVVEPIDVTIDYDTLPNVSDNEPLPPVPMKQEEDSSWDMFDD